MVRPIRVAIIVVAIGWFGPAGAARAPDWVTALKEVNPSPDFSDAPLVYLLDQQMAETGKSKAKVIGRQAIRLQSPDAAGQPLLAAHIKFGEDFFLLGAWKIRPDGKVFSYGYQHLVDLDADGSYQFSMNKVKLLVTAGAAAGDVIAWEYEIQSRPEAQTQFWWFGSSFPVVESRFGIKLPKGWRHRVRTRHFEITEPSRDDNGYLVWVMRNVEPVDPEPLGVPYRDLVPSLMVSYGPESAAGSEWVSTSWQRVAGWYAEIIEKQVLADRSINAAVDQISSGAESRIGAIREVTRLVQGIRYLDIAIGRSVAEPHPAAQVFKNRYGDCEDKTVLTLTMLRAMGVEAHPVLALTRDVGSVVPDFPTPLQFNHVIVAIRDPGEVPFPASFDLAGHGRYILFDPTDSITGFGDLSDSLQGTEALLATRDTTGLVSVPHLPADASMRESEVEVVLQGDTGEIEVRVSAIYSGGYASMERAFHEVYPGDRARDIYQTFLQSRFGKTVLRTMDVTGLDDSTQPVLADIAFRMVLPGRDLGTLKTLETQFALVTRALQLPKTERLTPLRIDSGFQEIDRTLIRIPPGWKVIATPEVPPASAPFGEYRLHAEERDGTLIVDRRLTIRAATIQPEQYDSARTFFAAVSRGDSAQIALEKTPGGGS